MHCGEPSTHDRLSAWAGRHLPATVVNVVSNLGLDVNLSTLSGEVRPLSQWLTTFHLASVVLDPYTNESSWVLDPATRILQGFRDSSARVNLVVTSDAAGARSFLGPLADEYMVFCDPDRSLVRSLGLDQLPAFVFILSDGSIKASAQGWNPPEWKTVADAIAEVTSWLAPVVPGPNDPGAFQGTAALG